MSFNININSTFTTVKSFPNGNTRPLVTITPKPPTKHTATLFFFHGLGDSSEGWSEVLESQFATRIPGLKIVAPTAPQIPVTINRGTLTSAWCDLNCNSLDPMELLGILNRRPPRIESSWAEIVNMVNNELNSCPDVGLDKIIFGGFSLGAHIALWTALQLPSRCCCVLMLSGICLGAESNIQIKGGTNSKSDIRQTPILHCHGDVDQVIPLIGANITQQSVIKDLEDKIYYELKVFEGLGHSASPEEINYCIEWMKKRIEGTPIDDNMKQENMIPVSPYTLPLTICSNNMWIDVGSKVVIKELKSKPHLHGCYGEIKGFNMKKGRYTIEIKTKSEDSECETLSLQSSAFRLDSVEVDVINSDTTNKTMRVVSESDSLSNNESSDQNKNDLNWYQESTSSESDKVPQLLSPQFLDSSIRFRIGTQIRVRGLQKGASWNGCVGRIVEPGFKESNGRYRIDLGGEVGLDLKVGNMGL